MEEWERKRISTNPFLYTDGSLVETDVLEAQSNENNDGNNDAIDPDQTPQAEVPSRQVWTQVRTSSKTACSIDIDDEKVLRIISFFTDFF